MPTSRAPFTFVESTNQNVKSTNQNVKAPVSLRSDPGRPGTLGGGGGRRPGTPEPLAVAEGGGPGPWNDERRRQRSRFRGDAEAAELHGAKRAAVAAQRSGGKRRAGAAPRNRRRAGAARNEKAPGRRPSPAPGVEGSRAVGRSLRQGWRAGRGPHIQTLIIPSAAA